MGKWFVYFILISLHLLAFADSNKQFYKSATELDYPPFSVPKNGKAQGFSVDILRAVAREMKLNIRFKVGACSEIKQELKEGKLDVLPLVSYSKERDKYFDFSIPYIIMHGNIFVRKNNKSIKSEADLKNKEIIVMKGDTAHDYLLGKKLTSKIITSKTMAEAFRLLAKGKHDAVLAISYGSKKLIKRIKLTDEIMPVMVHENELEYYKPQVSGLLFKFCIAVKEGDKKLLSKINEGLIIIHKKGIHKKLIQEWFPDSHKKPFGILDFLFYFVIVIVMVPLLLIILLLNNLWIKKEVKAKTLELSQEVKGKQEALCKLEEAKQKAEEANRAKTEFLANMSHELRTPLNAINGFSDLLMSLESNPEKKEMLEHVHQSGEHLLRIIQDLLNLSKIESKELGVNLQEFNFEQVVEHICNNFQYQAKAKEIDFTWWLKSNVPLELKGDKYKLEQILFNLISNAIKFTDKGKVELQVSLKERSGGISIIEFIVSDTGIGIGKESLEKVFSQFVQGEFYLTKIHGGAGLGLSIVQSFVKVMGGDLKVESQVGQGSKFFISLPFEEVGSSDVKVETQSEKKIILKNYKILLAEDSPVNQMVTQSILEEYGASIYIAENGKEVFEKFKERDYHMILMDIQMPGMDGYETTTVLREMGVWIPILGYSAHVSDEDQERALKSGMNGFIEKPVKMEELVQTISSYLSKD